jgi:hypothetical protein
MGSINPRDIFGDNRLGRANGLHTCLTEAMLMPYCLIQSDSECPLALPRLSYLYRQFLPLATSEYKISLSEYKISLSEYKISLSEYKISLSEYKISLSEYKISLSE